MDNPSNLEFQKKFDSIAKQYNNVSNRYTVKKRIDELQCKNGLILEVGAAVGSITKKYPSAICTDISFQMCKQAKMDRKNVICCDAQMLPLKQNKFDTIISAEMIYYLENPEKFMKDAYQILKINGEILISMTNEKMNIVDKIRTKLRKLGLNKMYFDDGLVKFMKISTLENLLEEQNFEILSIEKKVLIPINFFDKINKILEKTLLNRFCIFIFVKAKK